MESKKSTPSQREVDRKIESFLYLYLLVSIGFILSITNFLSSYTDSLIPRHIYINLDIYCCCSILFALACMIFMLVKQNTVTTVTYFHLPKRYTRPLLIATYLFGVSCIVTDSITLWTLVGCLTTLYVRFVLSSLKISFVIILMLFLRKFSSASLLNASLGLVHVLATCICLMLRTALGNSRQFVPVSMWTSVSNCSTMFTNPLIEPDVNYIIAFDQEFYLTVAVILLVIWTNVKNCAEQRRKALHFNYQFVEDRSNTSRDTSIDTEIVDDYRHSEALSEAVQKEPNVDVGLVFGITIGAVLSIPYTFWWEKSLFADKRVELYTFHMLFIILMLFATVLSSIKLRNFPIPRLSGIAFPITILLFLLLFCCSWHSWFSFVALASQLRRDHFDVHETLAFIDHLLFPLQVIFQTYFIFKAFSYCAVVLKPKSSNTVRQCVLFLMVCNFVLWLHLVYFDLNHKDHSQIQIEFYGIRLWNVISKTTYPLCMFYRLFSSLCLFEICFLF